MKKDDSGFTRDSNDFGLLVDQSKGLNLTPPTNRRALPVNIPKAPPAAPDRNGSEKDKE